MPVIFLFCRSISGFQLLYLVIKPYSVVGKPLSFMEEIVYCKIAVQATMYCMGDMEYNVSLPSLKVQNLVS